MGTCSRFPNSHGDRELADQPVFHVHPAVAHLGELFVVRYNEKSLVEIPAQLEKQGVQFLCVGGIEVTRRFVGKNDLRVIDKGTGDGYPLLFSAGKGRRLVVGPVGQAQVFEQRHPLFFHFCFGFSGNPARYANILQGTEFGQQVVKLENKTDVLVAESGQLTVVHAGEAGIVELNGAGIGLIECSQDVQQGALSGTGRTDNTDDFSPFYRNINTFQYFYLSISLFYAPGLQHGAILSVVIERVWKFSFNPYICRKFKPVTMFWTLELASYLEDAPWPATKDELIDYAIRSGAPIEVVENLQELEDEGEIYEGIDDIWPDYPSQEDFFFNEDEY